MQRIHVDDLVGYLLETEAGFEVLNLPAVAQSTTTYDLGGGRTHIREKGDLLHPAHEPAEVLREIKKSMGSMLFSAQYQQSPEPAGGKIIKRKMLRYYSAVERRPTDRIVLSWDIALSEKEAADYSACVVLLNRGDLYYVLEVIRGKFPFNKLMDKIIEVKERYGKAASLVIEDGGISYGLIQALREKHVNVVDYKPKGDKPERLISQIDLFEGGSRAPAQGRTLAGSVCCRAAVVSRPPRRSGRCALAGSRLAPRGMEGATGSAKDNWTRRLNRHPGKAIWDLICKQLIQLINLNHLSSRAEVSAFELRI